MKAAPEKHFPISISSVFSNSVTVAAFHAGVTAWLALGVLVSGLFIIASYDHDHTGAGCRVCVEIRIAQGIIESCGLLGAAPCVAEGRMRYAALSVKPRRICFILFYKKPPDLKVKLNC
jgi:hypothetical protein